VATASALFDRFLSLAMLMLNGSVGFCAGLLVTAGMVSEQSGSQPSGVKLSGVSSCAFEGPSNRLCRGVRAWE
jgi:hypothetical protein